MPLYIVQMHHFWQNRSVFSPIQYIALVCSFALDGSLRGNVLAEAALPPSHKCLTNDPFEAHCSCLRIPLVRSPCLVLLLDAPLEIRGREFGSDELPYLLKNPCQKVGGCLRHGSEQQYDGRAVCYPHSHERGAPSRAAPFLGEIVTSSRLNGLSGSGLL